MTTIVNMTPHPIHILGEDNQVIKTFPKGEGVIRLSSSVIKIGEVIDGVELSKTVFGEPIGLPEEKWVANCPLFSCSGSSKEEAYKSLTESPEYHSYGWHFGDEITINPETYYIVSQLVKTALPNRRDLLVPAEVVRDSNGNILGCKSLGY